MFSEDHLTQTNLLRHIEAICESNYGNREIGLIERVMEDIVDLFQGKKPGYQACDTEYHNLLHTFQTIPPFVEMIDGWNKEGAAPRVSKKYFTFGTMGVLLHDTGYIKKEGDNEGTGAKYTFSHIERSIEFASSYLTEIGFNNQDVLSILNIIHCTGVTLDIDIIFNNDQERVVGFALGTADLLGQMSAENYPDKIPVLYNEFAEAYRHNSQDSRSHSDSSSIPTCPQDLLRSTPAFYERIALARFKIMGSLYSYIPSHYGSIENPYIVAIENNIGKIQHILKNKVFPDR